MKPSFYKSIITALGLLTGTSAWAYDFEKSGIFYNITSEAGKTVEVTYQQLNSSNYEGNIVIPGTVENNNTSYSVTNIGRYAFYGCNAMQSVVIGNKVTNIGLQAFSSCNGFTSIVIPDNVTRIEFGAFAGCNGLTSINIPGSIKNVEKEVFRACEHLISAELGDGIESIGEGVFSDCISINSIKLGNSLRIIEKRAFYNCPELSSIVMPNSVTSIGEYAFATCKNLSSVALSTGITHIGEYAFYLSGITSIVIPDSMTKIENGVFAACGSLAFVSIPASVTYIGDGAFGLIKNLMDIYAYNDTPPECGTYVFEWPDYVTLHVPAGSVEDYKTTEPWKWFRNIAGDASSVKTTIAGAKSIFFRDNRLIINGVENPQIKIYNINGRLVLQAKGNDIDVSQLAKGIYIAGVNGITEKIIKM